MKKFFAAFVIVAVASATPARADQKVEEALAKAEQSIKKGKPEEAEKNILKLLSGSATPEAYIAAAWIQERVGSIDGALATFAKAPAGNPDVLAAQASFALRSGSSKDALAKAQEAVKLAATPTTLAALASAQARMGDPKALESADKAVAAGATSAAAHEARGTALLAAGKGGDAVAAFRKALEIDPNRASARLGVAEALIASNKAAEAVAEAKPIAEADPRNGYAYAVWGKAILAQNPKDQKVWGEAIGQAQQGAFLSPKSARVLYAVGQIFEAQPNRSQALANYKKALEADPGFAPAQAAVSKLELASVMADPGKGAAVAKKAAEAAPNDGNAQLVYGKVLLLKQDFPTATPVLEKATALLAKNAEAWALLGTAYNFQGKRNEALGAYEKAVQIEPNNNDYVESYALLLGLAKQASRGISVLKPIVEAPGYNSADGWINLGWLYRNSEPKRATESIHAYGKAIQLDPKNPQPYLGVGWAHIYNRASDHAIAAFQKALAVDPKVDGEAYDGIAWAQYFKKDMNAAKGALARAEAAQRPDQRLKDSIRKYEDAVRLGEEAARRALAEEKGPAEETHSSPCALAMSAASGGSAAQRRAAPTLAQCGAQGAQMLTWMLRNGDPGVKSAACSALGSMGGAGRSAVPTLQWFVAQEGAPGMDLDRKAMEREIATDEARRACRAALARLQ